MVITCSIDTTCSIWDINKESTIKTLIAHDKEVFDVSLSHDPQVFATVGADGSVRHFDIRYLKRANVRDLTKSDILHEANEYLVRVAWNKNNRHNLAVIAMNDNSVTLLDTRKNTPLTTIKLSFHKAPVNNLAWAPHSFYHICTVSDDKQALIWDLKKTAPEIKAPLLEYSASGQISNLSWGIQESDWVALCFNNQMQILRVY